MRIIIVGCGTVGTALVLQLSAEGHDITVIDERPEVVRSAVDSNDAMGIVGNGASFQILNDAGVKTADLLVAVTESDELNLLCCLIAKKAGNCHTIARVRNPVYRDEIGFIRQGMGLSMVINPEEAAATEIARLLKFPSADKIETFVGGRAELVHMMIGPENRLVGQSLAEVTKEHKSTILIAVVERGDDSIIPSGSFVLQAGDRISIIGASREIALFFKRLGLPTTRVKSAMIVGGGNTAFYLGRQLITFGIELKIIERDLNRCKELTELLPEALILHADGTDKDVLLEEDAVGVGSFVALTNIDEENIMLSMYIHSIAPKAKLITKVHRVSYSEIIGSLGVGSIIYPPSITANRIAQFVRGMAGSQGSSVERLYLLSDGKAEALEFAIRENTRVCGIPLSEMTLKPGVLIALINRGAEIIVPNGRTEIQTGDTVVVVTGRIGCKKIEDILR
ncbi:MAG: Trk system potassium transporter TrkA [Butyrivibrio sp.]|nr:Trk system potassium transporter TrkA [Butyrivibrio sp.]